MNDYKIAKKKGCNLLNHIINRPKSSLVKSQIYEYKFDDQPKISYLSNEKFLQTNLHSLKLSKRYNNFKHQGSMSSLNYNNRLKFFNLIRNPLRKKHELIKFNSIMKDSLDSLNDCNETIVSNFYMNKEGRKKSSFHYIINNLNPLIQSKSRKVAQVKPWNFNSFCEVTLNKRRFSEAGYSKQNSDYYKDLTISPLAQKCNMKIVHSYLALRKHASIKKQINLSSRFDNILIEGKIKKIYKINEKLCKEFKPKSTNKKSEQHKAIKPLHLQRIQESPIKHMQNINMKPFYGTFASNISRYNFGISAWQ